MANVLHLFQASRGRCLRRELRGQRGMMCRVIVGGTIRRGDSVERVS